MMATNDKESNAAGTDNRSPMLEESDFESWKIRIERYIHGKPLGKLIWKSIKNGPTPHPMITVTTREGEQQTQVTRKKTDEEFTEFVIFHKMINDIKITNKEIHVYQRNTKFVNNLPSYWGKYVTIVKNSKDVSTVSYIDLYTHLKSYEQHAMKTLSKMNQTSGNADPLAYIAQTTQSSSYTPSQYVPLPPQYAPAPQQAPQSTNDAMLATMNQIVNLLKSVHRRASGNKGNRLPLDLKWFRDKALLMEAKEKGVILDAEAEAFSADVECTTPYAEPLAITTTTLFEVSHEDAYDSDVDEEPYAAAAFLANPMQIGPSTREGNNNDSTFLEGLHKTALGYSNPLYLKTDQLCHPSLYLGDVILDPVHTPIRVYDSEETLVQAEVSRTKMLEKMKDPLCKVLSKSVNYAKLNSLYDTFVPQKQLFREQVYWLPATEVASYNCNKTKPVTEFVRTRPAKSQVNTHLKFLKACFLEFDKVVKDKTTPSYITNREWHFEHNKKCFVDEIIPFYEKLKTYVKGIEDNIFKEISEYMKIFDELEKVYDQCVIHKKSLEIENKNLLIQNECLLAESVSKDICSVVLTFDIAVPRSVDPRSNCVKEHSRNLELEVEILKVKQLLVEKEKRCSFIETKYQELELKFQKYKACFENRQVCNNSSSPKLNVFFEINNLKDQLQGKDELIRKLKAQISKMKEVSADPNLSTLEFQGLETESTQLKKEPTAVRIKNDSLRDENVSIKKHYQDLYKSKAESNSNVSSGASVPEKPKVLALGFYAMTLNVGSKWKPTERKFTLGDTCPLTRITKPDVVPLEKSRSVSTSEPAINVTVTPRLAVKCQIATRTLNKGKTVYRVMYPLTTQQERKTQKDYDTKRGHHFTSSSSAFDQPSSFYLNNDDDDDGDDDDDRNDKGTSHASTSSLTPFVNSLTNKVPRVFETPPKVDPNMEPFYTR
nr:hypothetical protein [Tanacetum cinerariifolium]